MTMTIWPPIPTAIPTRSMRRKRTPRSARKWRVPCRRLASQGAPKKPIHKPSRVETTYHSGGTGAEAMDVICAAGLPGDDAGDHSEDPGQELPDDEAGDGVDEPGPGVVLGGRWNAGSVEEGAIPGHQLRGWRDGDGRARRS